MANRYGLQIRTALGSDASGLAEFLAQAGQTVGVDVLANRLEGLHRSSSGVALIAVEWGPPTGVVVVNWMQTLSDDLPVAQISLLLVSPDERRRGVGRLLLKAASQATRTAGCGSMLLAAPLLADASVAAFCAATGFEAHGAVYARALRKKV
nr:GNAT family N-acetyltransferase [Beijerinckia sp. L45]